MKQDEIVGDDPSSAAAAPSVTAAGIKERSPQDGVFLKIPAGEVKGKTVRGGVVVMANQGLGFVLQTATTIILARLLSPSDFGLQGMVVAMTGVLGLFRDVGLSAATVQRDVITHEQLSTLFWINVAAGIVLALLATALAPALVAFYNEPRLFWITIVSSLSFVLGGVTAQHGALLQRNMRYVTIAKIGIASGVISSALGVVMAMRGYGYWALVGMGLCGPGISSAGLLLAVRWLPGKPQRGCGIRSMLHFGGVVTCNQLVVYLGYNVEKILLGRYWGAAALGLYGRAFQLLNLPLQQMHNSIHSVAFPALSRVQNDASRLCRSFLQGYSVLLSLTIPITMASALFSDEIIAILLGPKWNGAGPILWLLTPTILTFGMINPFGWFLVATGRTMRSLKIAVMIAPTVILGIALGIRHGPQGVALGYSAAMCFLLVPVIVWAIHDTGITLRDYWQVVKKPLIAGCLAIGCGFIFKFTLGNHLVPILRLTLGLGLVCSIYAWLLLIVMSQKALFMDLMSHIFQSLGSKQERIQSS